jgi:manganese-dependent inorganic pyrophosphatase
MDKVYVVGHLTPDTDTIVAAMSLAAFLNARDRTDRYVAVMTGKQNSETDYIFKRFDLDFPEIMTDATNKKLFLVDHNESSQMIKGATSENIIGFVDHHKLKFENSVPVEIITKPWGSSCTLIFDMFKKELLDIPRELKPAILSAILSDTVITKSPTTTPVDVMVIEELSQELSIDYKELGMEMFKAKAKISDKTALQIIKNDFKDFDFSGKKIGIGQMETADLTEIESRTAELVSEMKKLKENEGYHSLVLMLTDIMQEGSKLLIVSDDENKVADIFKTSLSNNLSEFIPGMMSRKKQVAPVLSENI